MKHVMYTNKQEKMATFINASMKTHEIKLNILLTSLLFSLMSCGSRDMKSLQKGIAQYDIHAVHFNKTLLMNYLSLNAKYSGGDSINMCLGLTTEMSVVQP